MIATIDRTTPPASLDIGDIQIRQADKSMLDNGIPVYTVNAGFQDLVRIELIFFNTGYDVDQPLAMTATNRMLSEGSSKHTGQQLSGMIDGTGAFYETEESADYCSVVLFTLNKHLDRNIPVLREIITDAVFPEKELSTFRQNNRQRLTVDNEKVKTISRKKFNEVLFGAHHPYGYYTKPEDYDQLKRETLQSHYLENYRSGNCNIIVAGKVTDATLASLNKFFGKDDWKRSGEKPGADVSVKSDPQKKYLIEKKEAVQSSIRIGKMMFNKTHPDFIGMTILNTALGGYFGSRLMDNIREDKGYTYSIGSAVVSMKQAGYFFISTEVGSAVTSQAVDEIYKEVDKLSKESLEEYELQMVKNFMTGSFLKDIDGAFHLADRWKSLLLYGMSYEYYQRYLDTVKNIKPEELKELARKHLNSADFYEVVVGKK